MPIPTHPKTYARNIALGFAPFTVATVRRHSAGELKTINGFLEVVMREYRGLNIPLEDVKALQQRNMNLQRANTALMLIRNYCKRKRIVL